jgi:hypothetical protein
MGLAFDDFEYEIARGDDRKIDFTVELDGVAQNITGWSVRFTGRLTKPGPEIVSDADAVMAYSVGSGITLTTPASGILRVQIDGEDTYGLPVADTVLFCDLQGVDGSGNVGTLTTGKITVKAEITRATT